MTKKAIQETCEFFMHFLRYITSNNQIAFHGIRSLLKLFQALKHFFILQTEENTQSRGILADEIKYEKVRYLVFKKCVINVIKHFNV